MKMKNRGDFHIQELITGNMPFTCFKTRSGTLLPLYGSEFHLLVAIKYTYFLYVPIYAILL